MKKFKNALLTLASMLMIATPAVLAPAAVFAANPIQDAICNGVNTATGSSTSTVSSSGCSGSSTTDANAKFASIITTVINLFSIIVGAAAVIMIIVGGFRYITSGGESNKVSGAKNTIVYALAGLIIVALSQFIVHYVLAKVTG